MKPRSERTPEDRFIDVLAVIFALVIVGVMVAVLCFAPAGS